MIPPNTTHIILGDLTIRYIQYKQKAKSQKHKTFTTHNLHIVRHFQQSGTYMNT